MINHKVKKGKKNYKPGHGLGLGLVKGGYKLTFVIPKSAWYNREPDGPLGRDGRDINKLGGVSYFNPLNPRTWPKNHDAALVGWRPGIEQGSFEIFAYVNDTKGGHQAELLGIVSGGEKCLVVCGRWDRKKAVSYRMNGIEIRLPVRRRNFQINVGPWFGGTLPAPFDMELQAIQKL